MYSIVFTQSIFYRNISLKVVLGKLLIKYIFFRENIINNFLFFKKIFSKFYQIPHFVQKWK